MEMKKGAAEIVAVVFLITLVISLSAVLFTVVISKTDILSSPEYTCLEVIQDKPVKILSSCFNEETGDFEVVVSFDISSELEVGQIDFNFYESGNLFDSKWTCGDESPECSVPEKGDGKTFYFSSMGIEAEDWKDVKKVGLFVGKKTSCLSDEKVIGVCVG